jgi:SMC interacting uncharacterized protein involved in chromosome segregation
MRIEINGKTYISERITMLIAKKAMALYNDSVKFVDKAKQLENKNSDINEQLEKVSNYLQESMQLKEEKCELIVSVLGGKITYDELNEAITPEEVEVIFNRIILNISGVIEKNG